MEVEDKNQVDMVINQEDMVAIISLIIMEEDQIIMKMVVATRSLIMAIAMAQEAVDSVIAKKHQRQMEDLVVNEVVDMVAVVHASNKLIIS